jgi:hypothetical protein
MRMTGKDKVGQRSLRQPHIDDQTSLELEEYGLSWSGGHHHPPL